MEKNKKENKNIDTPKNRKIFRIVCSVLVALIIWAYVDEEKTINVKMAVNDLPVEFSGEDTTLADKGLMLLAGYDTTVDLVLKGPRKVLWKLNKDEIRIVADTSSIQDTGTQTLTYEVVCPDNVQRSQIQVESASLYAITVAVGELYTKQVPIYCEVTGRVADGYIAEELVLDPSMLVLRAQRDELLNVSYAKIRVNINGIKETLIHAVEYQLYDHNDIPIDDAKIRVASRLIQVMMPVKAVKEVPLRLNFVEAVGSTMQQVEYTIEPSAMVQLKGDKQILDSIESIVLDTIYLQDLDENQTLEYTISVPDGAEIVGDNTQVTVQISMTGVSERRVNSSNFVCTNVAEGLDAVITTESLSVSVRGLSEQIDALTGEDLLMTVDLSNITEVGTYTLPVSVVVNGYDNVGVKGSYQAIVTVQIAQQDEVQGRTIPDNPVAPASLTDDESQLAADPTQSA